MQFFGENAQKYFWTFQIENKVRIQANGKLRSHFDYAKEELRADGMIKRHAEKSVPAETRSLIFSINKVCDNIN